MSTIAVPASRVRTSPVRAAVAPPRTRLRLTARGRRVIASLVALPVVAALTIGVWAGASAMAGDVAGSPAGTFETVTAVPGDSLWAIAGQVAPDADPRDVVGAIVRLNALDSVTLTPGQQLAIPTEYASAR